MATPASSACNYIVLFVSVKGHLWELETRAKVSKPRNFQWTSSIHNPVREEIPGRWMKREFSIFARNLPVGFPLSIFFAGLEKQAGIWKAVWLEGLSEFLSVGAEDILSKKPERCTPHECALSHWCSRRFGEMFPDHLLSVEAVFHGQMKTLYWMKIQVAVP
ncbi:hypothetical protein [Anaerolinea thermophila]|uniref:hypothetical protein n=2 Tax=Anaerolinea TaxID=233189 RepID=UPI0026F2C6ED|nr:hypothetical protein [Anaerolinea thermophila]